ncbi:Protein trichome birefringence-like 8, partial [Cucurbita argyrosperma subsp. argyrosperma]
MENGFGMRLMHSTLTPRIAPSLILDSGASKMAGMMTVTGSGSGRRTAAISRERFKSFRKIDSTLQNTKRLLFLRRGETEYGCNGSILWVATDIEAMGGGTFGSKLNSSFLSRVFSCSSRKEATKPEDEPENNIFISNVIKQMDSVKHKVQVLNITYLTEFRKDEHPSKNRGPDTPDEASLVPAWNTRYEE